MSWHGPIVIAEAGVNHNGSVERACAMVRAAADCGVDLVKFQAFEANELASADCAAAAYQLANAGARDQRSMLKALELTLDDFAQIAAACRSADIGFLCTPFSAGMTEALVALGMEYIKVASGELTNHPALASFARFGLPVFLSTGMATLDEVRAAVAVLEENGAGPVTVLHCTSLYPCPIERVNLRAMVTMGEALGRPVGYSDHTLDDHVSVAATALGATVIEKHFTLDRNLPGPDHAASLEPEALARLVRRVRDTAMALGDGVKAPVPEEVETARLVRRSWHAARDLRAGSTIAAVDVVLKRPATGLPPSQSPVGRRLDAGVAVDAPLREEDFVPA